MKINNRKIVVSKNDIELIVLKAVSLAIPNQNLLIENLTIPNFDRLAYCIEESTELELSGKGIEYLLRKKDGITRVSEVLDKMVIFILFKEGQDISSFIIVKQGQKKKQLKYDKGYLTSLYLEKKDEVNPEYMPKITNPSINNFLGNYVLIFQKKGETDIKKTQLSIQENGEARLLMCDFEFLGSVHYDSTSFYINLRGANESIFAIFKIGMYPNYKKLPTYTGGIILYTSTARNNNPRAISCFAILSKKDEKDIDYVLAHKFFDYLYLNSFYMLPDEAVELLKTGNKLVLPIPVSHYPYTISNIDVTNEHYINKSMYVWAQKRQWKITIHTNEIIEQITHKMDPPFFNERPANVNVEITESLQKINYSIEITKIEGVIGTIIKFIPPLPNNTILEYTYTYELLKSHPLCIEDFNYAQSQHGYRYSKIFTRRHVTVPVTSYKLTNIFPKEFLPLIKSLKTHVSRHNIFNQKEHDRHCKHLYIDSNQFGITFINPVIGFKYGIEWLPPKLEDLLKAGVLSEHEMDFILANPDRLYKNEN